MIYMWEMFYPQKDDKPTHCDSEISLFQVTHVDTHTHTPVRVQWLPFLPTEEGAELQEQWRTVSHQSHLLHCPPQLHADTSSVALTHETRQPSILFVAWEKTHSKDIVNTEL